MRRRPARPRFKSVKGSYWRSRNLGQDMLEVQVESRQLGVLLFGRVAESRQDICLPATSWYLIKQAYRFLQNQR